MNDKFILDATAGFRMMWFDKHHPNTIYLDQRPECEPDIVSDFRDLKEFPDETFRLIVFDPPHIIKNNNPLMSNMQHDFGSLKPDTWDSDIRLGFNELWRVLAPMGILLFKWNTISRTGAEILSILPIKPLIYQISHEREPKKRHGIHIKTLWFCFMKIPQQEGR